VSEAGIVAITVAMIGAVGSAGAVVAAALAKRLERRIGEPNGHGPLHEAVSGIAHQVEDHGDRLDQIAEAQRTLAGGMATMLSGQAGQDNRLAVHDAELAELRQRLKELAHQPP
jgi:ATP-dependent protease ClpP protease subunit